LPIPSYRSRRSDADLAAVEIESAAIFDAGSSPSEAGNRYNRESIRLSNAN
jgi:hypothetical protein